MDGDRGALDGLASSLRRPTASLAAFRGLSAEELELLTNAINETSERRRREIDAQLARSLPALPRSMIVRVFRGPRFASLRRPLIQRTR
jgi:hypothetical protein